MGNTLIQQQEQIIWVNSKQQELLEDVGTLKLVVRTTVGSGGVVDVLTVIILRSISVELASVSRKK